MPVIEVEGLRKAYGGKVAVEDVAFAVQEGEILGLLGPNGAGKTTTVEILEGLTRRDAGRVEVLGCDPARDLPRLRERIGVQLQETALPDKLRVREALELYASFYPDPRPAADLVGALRLEDRLEVPYAKLSGGQRQRLAVALALIGRPQVAFLDEMTTGLDPAARRDAWELIARVRDEGTTILLVTHFMEEASRLCDRVAVMRDGRLRAIGAPASLSGQGGATVRLSFRPSTPLDASVFAGLEGVTAATADGERIAVEGAGDLLAVVVAALVRRGVVPEGMRSEQLSLEDAYLDLTTDHEELPA